MRNRYDGQQIIRFLREAELGIKVKVLCRRLWFSESRAQKYAQIEAGRGAGGLFKSVARHGWRAPSGPGTAKAAFETKTHFAGNRPDLIGRTSRSAA